MKKKILAFGASSSRNSINKQLATFAANQVEGAAVRILDLNDFEMPIYSIDKERTSGIPALAKQFKQHIMDADSIIISFAEHNGSFSAAYKNIYDWVSRIDQNVWENKALFLMATSPGGRGGTGVLQAASNTYRYSNKNTIVDFSLPSFHQNFSIEKGIVNEELRAKFQQQLDIFMAASNSSIPSASK